jgi:AcrR family transcriptional regulator
MTKHLPEDVRRQQILDAARTCFIDKGYYPTRMEDIARIAQLSKGGIYFHFGSKKEIFEALVRQEYEESTAFLRDISAQPGSYADKFQAMARHYIESFGQRPDYPRFFMVMGEMAGRDESVRQMLAALQAEYTEVVAAILEAGIAAGSIKPVDSRAAATLLKGLIDAIEGYTALGVAMNTEQLLATGLEMVMNGLALHPPAKR